MLIFSPLPDDDTTAFLAAVEAGIDDADAGRTVPYEGVRRWLLSWGTENELPPIRFPHLPQNDHSS